MPNNLHSETFKEVASLTKKLNSFQFDESIDFYQQVDPTTISVPNSTQDAWAGGVLAPNGKIYGMPINSGNTTSYILEITKTFPRVMTNWILYPQFNKL